MKKPGSDREALEVGTRGLQGSGVLMDIGTLVVWHLSGKKTCGLGRLPKHDYDSVKLSSIIKLSM